MGSLCMEYFETLDKAENSTQQLLIFNTSSHQLSLPTLIGQPTSEDHKRNAIYHSLQSVVHLQSKPFNFLSKNIGQKHVSPFTAGIS